MLSFVKVSQIFGENKGQRHQCCSIRPIDRALCDTSRFYRGDAGKDGGYFEKPLKLHYFLYAPHLPIHQKMDEISAGRISIS